MSIISQFSRMLQHTVISNDEVTFTVPQSEDFTDGTWTMFDLSLSEIGVDETNQRAYIRIGDEIKEFNFTGTQNDYTLLIDYIDALNAKIDIQTLMSEKCCKTIIEHIRNIEHNVRPHHRCIPEKFILDRKDIIIKDTIRPKRIIRYTPLRIRVDKNIRDKFDSMLYAIPEGSVIDQTLRSGYTEPVKYILTYKDTIIGFEYDPNIFWLISGKKRKLCIADISHKKGSIKAIEHIGVLNQLFIKHNIVLDETSIRYR